MKTFSINIYPDGTVNSVEHHEFYNLEKAFKYILELFKNEAYKSGHCRIEIQEMTWVEIK